MFSTFRQFDIDSGECVIHGVTGGSGPPLLLLHGYPQTHRMWHRIAPALAKHYTVVAADLRGYGRSGKPLPEADHSSYSKRAMARDMVAVMQALGHGRFRLVGHDRGGRVAHRLVADHEQRVEQWCVLDIAPTREMYRDTTDGFARAYWHWFFLIQPAPFPEQLINADPVRYLMHKLGSGSAGMTPFSAEALTDYTEAYRNPDTVRASCEDYRAAATIDIEHDDADGITTVSRPLLVLWGANGVIDAHFDPLSLWRERASDVSGCALPGGHYLPEECPDQVLECLLGFFSNANTV